MGSDVEDNVSRTDELVHNEVFAAYTFGCC
jgi:hypothetical protein